MKRILGITILLSLVSCSNTKIQKELEKAKNELITAKATIETLKKQIEPEGKLVHVVFFKLKPEADLNALGIEINKLKEIAVIKDLQFGFFKNLGDERVLSEYSLMLEMSFDNEASYKVYQEHPIHLALKEVGIQFLTSPPVTYDYIKQ
ncbi:Dabb family protein [Hyunsoonleella sp. 2307UL5-6]|uniref:Dabb family protein n=1 Tax=Hyunsoonleella sp. 2307UL5-6 TaxID=3384768 RepID=UPI0039BC92D0